MSQESPESPEQPCPPVDHATAAQRAAEERLAGCWAYFHEEAEQPEGMSGPFDGCLTCEVREVLDAAYPHLRAMWEAERAEEARQADTER